MAVNVGDAEIMLQQAKGSVEALYEFRDKFFDHHKIEEAGVKNDLVKEELRVVVENIEKHQAEMTHSAEFHLLKGKALNVQQAFDQAAMESLAKAVKLDPKLGEAWIHLGECYWKKGDVSGAHNCFLGALSHSKDKKALRNLSMVLRQLGKTPEEKQHNIQESVTKAKEAVALDIKDGTSWFVLGNAYMSEFFSSGKHDLKTLQQCMGAYNNAEIQSLFEEPSIRRDSCWKLFGQWGLNPIQSNLKGQEKSIHFNREKDSISRNTSDLHFNRAMLHKYKEEYEEALNGFSRAGALDPTWEEPKEKEEQLVKYLTEVTDLIHTKGKIKGKKLQSAISSIKESDLGPFAGGEFSSKGKTVKLENTLFSALTPGLNKETVIVGKVIGSVMTEDLVPFTFGMVDSAGTCVSVTAYNLAVGTGVKIGDSVAVPEPWLDSVHIQYRGHEFQYQNIRVENPLVLAVNGRKQGREVLAPSILSTTVSTS